MPETKPDLPVTLAAYRNVAARRRLRPEAQSPGPAKDPRRDQLAESLAAAEEIAEILAAQAGDDIAYYRRQASQIVGFMLNAGWTITRR